MKEEHVRRVSHKMKRSNANRCVINEIPIASNVSQDWMDARPSSDELKRLKTRPTHKYGPRCTITLESLAKSIAVDKLASS